jgi:phosphoglycerate dehydrogenase-like enzyme
MKKQDGSARLQVVVLTSDDPEWVSEITDSINDIADLTITSSSDENSLLEEASEADVIIPFGGKGRSLLNKGTLPQLGKLKLIVTSGIGFDGIDVDLAGDLGIPVATTVNFCRFEVAEHALALIFSVARKTALFDRVMRSGSDFRLKEALESLHRLHGKVAGVVGFGRSGKVLTAMLVGCGFDVLVYDHHAESKHDALIEVGAKAASFPDLLRSSDIISLHVPLTSETHHLIGQRELEAMKTTAILVNVSRGEVIDEKALYLALKNGQIAAAGLDVFEKEPFTPSNPLAELNNVVLSMHAASSSTESYKERLSEIATNIRRFAGGEELNNIVNAVHTGKDR